ncbi:wall-associated receptor kinase 2-like [Chenopodium quinoa]|uniref:Uncharacterized protein n=1 Tax=Chenopodium quinoa TaxID=63459 RepID=A0A803MHE3_CHEQI|nr:wall-associated receptor kinase 2-like [Chenopodium quinoa]
MEDRALSPLLWLWSTFFAMLFVTSFANIPIAKPGCPTKCGKVTIPYPFGIGLEKGCSLSEPYNIYCNTSTDPPKPYLLSNDSQHEIIEISQTGQMRIRNKLVTKCYQPRQKIEDGSTNFVEIGLINLPVVISDTANKFIAIGCDDDLAIMLAASTPIQGHVSGCGATCDTLEIMLKQNDTSCLGRGCCQSVIPDKGLKQVTIIAESLIDVGNTTNNNVSYCSAAFIAEVNEFTFNVADLFGSNAEFINRTIDNVPVVLDWYVGDNKTCQQAQQNRSGSGYACMENTNCTDVNGGTDFGYRCNCRRGYEGNPYLSPGCTIGQSSPIYFPLVKM